MSSKRSRMSIYGFTANEYTGLKSTCTADQLVGDGVYPYTRGEQVIESLLLTGLDYWQDLLILLAFIVFAIVALYFTLQNDRQTGQ